MSKNIGYQQKLNIAKDILVKDYKSLSQSQDFLSLIDKDKVYIVSINEFNKIIHRECFCENERAFIREQRRKAVNRKAAKVSRERRKSEEKKLEESMRKLEITKFAILKEKELLQQEILGYKRLFDSMQYANQTPYSVGGWHCY